jgi:hypothetical protein
VVVVVVADEQVYRSCHPGAGDERRPWDDSVPANQFSEVERSFGGTVERRMRCRGSQSFERWIPQCWVRQHGCRGSIVSI